MRFAALPKQWTPAAFSSQLRGSGPVKVQVAGEAVALFRDASGTARALLDRCPHRGVSLSLGQVTADGCLRCPFHGWEFRGDGSCARVPMNAEARLEGLSAGRLPTHEAGGAIWIYTDTDADAGQIGAPHVPEALLDPRFRVRTKELVWRCHWTRAMENMLDVPHLPYVHQRTIGAGLKREVAQDPAIQLEQDITPSEEGMRIRWRLGKSHDERVWLDWLRPNGMALNIPSPLGEYRQHLYCVPGAAGETRMMLLSARELPWPLHFLLSGMMSWFEDIIIHEDRAVVESSDPPEVPPAHQERSVATDRATLRFRAWYHREKARHTGIPAEEPALRVEA